MDCGASRATLPRRILMSVEDNLQVQHDLENGVLEDCNNKWAETAQGEVSVADSVSEAEQHFSSLVAASSVSGRLKGGTYTEAAALKLINSCYFLGLTENDVGIYRMNDDGSSTFISEKDFKLLLANVTVR